MVVCQTQTTPLALIQTLTEANAAYVDITNSDFNDCWRHHANIQITDNDDSYETNSSQSTTKAQMQDRTLTSLRIRAKRGSNEFVINNGHLFKRIITVERGIQLVLPSKYRTEISLWKQATDTVQRGILELVGCTSESLVFSFGQTCGTTSKTT